MAKNTVVNAKAKPGATKQAIKETRGELIHADGSSDAKPGRSSTPTSKTGLSALMGKKKKN